MSPGDAKRRVLLGDSAPAPEAPPDDTPDAPAADNLLAAIHVLSRRIGGAFQSRMAARFDLSIAEWRVMLALARRPGATAAEITGQWAMEKMAVNRAVLRLERMGRVARRRHRGDCRSYTLRLTAKGRRLYARALPAANDRYREILAALTRSEVAALESAVRKLVDHAARLLD